MIAASYIYQMMLDADVMNVRFLMSANADVAEFIAKEGSKVTKKPVKELGTDKVPFLNDLSVSKTHFTDKPAFPNDLSVNFWPL